MNASSHLVMFALDDRRFALPLETVDRVIRAVEVTPLPEAPDALLGVINVEGRIIPVVNLRRRCRVTERQIGPGDQFIIAHTSRRSVALPVDSADVIPCSPEMVVPVERNVSGPGGVHDVIKREDGLVPIYDLDAFLSHDDFEAVEQVSQSEGGAG